MSLFKLARNRIPCPIIMGCSNKILNRHIGKTLSRQDSNTNTLQHKALSSAAKTEEYKTIYRFPYIRYMSLIGKLKMYQSAVSGIMISGSCISSQIGFCTLDDTMSIIGMSLVGLVPMYSIGFLAHNLVGFVYLHNSEEKARVAYLDFWGNRKDQELLIKDVIPFEQLPGSITDRLYMKIKFNSSKEQMKIFTKYGAVYDTKSFNKIF